MADAERTHEATPKRKQEFRKKGDIALSRDLVGTATMAGAVIALVMFSSKAASAMLELARKSALATDGRETPNLGREAVDTFVTCVGPVVIGGAVFALVAMFGQLGWPPAFKKIGFDLTKMNPLTNLQQTFAIGAIAKRTGSTLAKMAVVGAAVFFVLKSGIGANMLQANELGAVAWKLVTRSLWVVLSVMAVIAVADYWMSRRKINEQMKMSADEVKREHKESEGDPLIKGKRRQRMRELAKRRLAKAVAGADVVVVNPTHYSVALRYHEDKDRAPIVVAKGVDEAAARIREIARENGVPVMSRPPLARALHKHVKEGQPIPANLFKAVAEVLAYVYRIKRGGAA